jgi:hypothetical protein
VRNASYISQRILTKLSQNLCSQVPWRILSGFCDWIIFDLIMALCFISLYKIYSEQFLLCAIPPTLFMINIAHSYIVCCLYLYFIYNIFIYNGDNWKPGFVALPCFLLDNNMWIFMKYFTINQMLTLECLCSLNAGQWGIINLFYITRTLLSIHHTCHRIFVTKFLSV